MRARRAARGGLAALALAAALPADGDAADRRFLDTPRTAKHALIMVGPTTSGENRERFRRWGFALHDVLLRDHGYADGNVALLHDRGPRGAPGDGRIDGACDRRGIEAALAALDARAAPGDQITLYLVGHGAGAGAEAKFNIVGPDITGGEFAAMLERFGRQSVAVVNGTSASHGFSAALSAAGRVVISSTRSASERYDPVFPGYFIEALDGRGGDRDKNGRVSMLEAFEYARDNVRRWYEERDRLAAEHAGLDDDGDGLFALEPAPGRGDGRLAEIAYVDVLADAAAGLGPEALALRTRMRELERSALALRGRRDDFLQDDYWRRMKALLLELARTTERFDALAADGGPR